MSIDAMNAVWEHSQSTGSARVIMLCLANYADANSIAWPSVALLAKRARITPRNVRKHLDALTKAGEITAVGSGIRGVVKYKITCAPLVEIAPCRGRHPTPVATDTGSSVAGDSQPLTKPKLNPKLSPVPRGEGRGKRLDVEALPDPWRDWAIAQGHMNPNREWLKFFNYWTSKAGSGATKLDWGKTWQNWILRALESPSSNGRSNTAPCRTRFDVLDELERQQVYGGAHYG